MRQVSKDLLHTPPGCLPECTEKPRDQTSALVVTICEHIHLEHKYQAVLKAKAVDCTSIAQLFSHAPNCMRVRARQYLCVRWYLVQSTSTDPAACSLGVTSDCHTDFLPATHFVQYERNCQGKRQPWASLRLPNMDKTAGLCSTKFQLLPRQVQDSSRRRFHVFPWNSCPSEPANKSLTI